SCPSREIARSKRSSDMRRPWSSGPIVTRLRIAVGMPSPLHQEIIARSPRPTVRPAPPAPTTDRRAFRLSIAQALFLHRCLPAQLNPALIVNQNPLHANLIPDVHEIR